MKNFKRKINDDGSHFYEYDDYGQTQKVKCCSEGWINLTDLEPDPRWFGIVQIIKRYKAEKIIDAVGVLHAEEDYLGIGHKFLFKTKEFEATHWQPLANMRKG